MTLLRFLPWVGYPLAAICFGLWLSARDRIIEVQGECDASKIQESLAATQFAFDAYREAAEQREQDLASIAEREREAARIARKAQEAAEGRPAKVVEVVKNVSREELAGKCLDIPIPDGVLDELRAD